MKRYKVKFSDEETDKHEATRSYDEEEIIQTLLEIIRYQKDIIESQNAKRLGDSPPTPSLSFRVYDRKKVAEV